MKTPKVYKRRKADMTKRAVFAEVMRNPVAHMDIFPWICLSALCLTIAAAIHFS